MAVDTFCMAAGHHSSFSRVMCVGGSGYWMTIKFIKFCFDIMIGDMAIVTAQTVTFFSIVIEDTLLTSSIMGRVTVFTGIAGNCGGLGMGPWVWTGAIPGAASTTMRGLAPVIFNMAGLA